MSHTYNISDLQQKMIVLVHLFGKEKFIKEDIKEPTLNRWLNGLGITKKNAILLSQKIGMSIDDFESNRSEFIESLISCYSKVKDVDYDRAEKTVKIATEKYYLPVMNENSDV